MTTDMLRRRLAKLAGELANSPDIEAVEAIPVLVALDHALAVGRTQELLRCTGEFIGKEAR